MENSRNNFTSVIGILAALFLLITNAIFAFIGGTVFFKTIFHVPVYIGTFIMAIFYVVMIFVICSFN
jgi:Mn2+/Fe2+ NRAMP family transporter